MVLEAMLHLEKFWRRWLPTRLEQDPTLSSPLGMLLFLVVGWGHSFFFLPCRGRHYNSQPHMGVTLSPDPTVPPSSTSCSSSFLLHFGRHTTSQLEWGPLGCSPCWLHGGHRVNLRLCLGCCTTLQLRMYVEENTPRCIHLHLHTVKFCPFPLTELLYLRQFLFEQNTSHNTMQPPHAS